MHFFSGKKAPSVEHLLFIHSAVHATQLKTAIIPSCISLWHSLSEHTCDQTRKYNCSQSLPSKEIQESLAKPNALRGQDSLAETNALRVQESLAKSNALRAQESLTETNSPRTDSARRQKAMPCEQFPRARAECRRLQAPRLRTSSQGRAPGAEAAAPSQPLRAPRGYRAPAAPSVGPGRAGPQRFAKDSGAAAADCTSVLSAEACCS